MVLSLAQAQNTGYNIGYALGYFIGISWPFLLLGLFMMLTYTFVKKQKAKEKHQD